MHANVDNLNLNITFRAVFSTVSIVAILNDLGSDNFKFLSEGNFPKWWRQLQYANFTLVLSLS